MALLLSKPEEIIAFRLGSAIWQNEHYQAEIARLAQRVKELEAAAPKEKGPAG